MPLLTQNKRIERVSSAAELFSKHPHLKESAQQFVSRSPESVDPKQLLYVQQREFAVTTPADNSLSILGSDDATTCHLVVLRHTDMNDVIRDGMHRPVVYGIGVNVKTGHVFPASFTCRGPAEELRSARTFSGAQCVSDLQDELALLIDFWSGQYLSTSPHAEPPHFVHHIKSTIQFLLDHPTADGLFPHLYRRAEDGRWKRA